jgi:hypothetical protein
MERHILNTGLQKIRREYVVQHVKIEPCHAFAAVVFVATSQSRPLP